MAFSAIRIGAYETVKQKYVQISGAEGTLTLLGVRIAAGVTTGIINYPKIQQTKMLVTCQRFSDWFLFGLVWQYSSIQKNIIKVGAKSWMLTCSCHITLSLPFYTDPDSKRELNFCNCYLSLLYFWDCL